MPQNIFMFQSSQFGHAGNIEGNNVSATFSTLSHTLGPKMIIHCCDLRKKTKLQKSECSDAYLLTQEIQLSASLFLAFLENAHEVVNKKTGLIKL